MGLEEITTITLTNASKQASQQTFNVPLFYGYHTAWAERVRSYTDLAAVVTDGIAASHPLYKAAAAMFAQPNHPATFKIGRGAVPATMSLVLTPTASNLTVYTIKVNDTVATFTSDSTATVAEICTGLAAAVTALSLTGVTATASSTTLTIAGTTGTYVTVEVVFGVMAVDDQTADPGLSAELDAVLAADSGWYGFTTVQHSKLCILAAVAWSETNKKLYFACTQDSAVTTSATTDVASALVTGSYARTLLLYHQAPQQFPQAAWLGQLFPYTPGSANYAFKTLSGVDVSTLSGGAITNMKAKNCNYYHFIEGVGVTLNGILPVGQWADTLVGNDWMVARLANRLFTLEINNKKLSYTNDDIAKAEKELRAQILEGIDNQFINPDNTTYSVTVKDVKDISASVRGTRRLPMSLKYQLAGAINAFDVDVTYTS